MKATLLLLLYVSSSMSGKPKGHSYREVLGQSAPGGNGMETNRRAQMSPSAGMIGHPQYEQRTYEQIQTAELVCCVSQTEGSTEATSQTNLPSPTNFPSYSYFPPHTNVASPTTVPSYTYFPPHTNFPMYPQPGPPPQQQNGLQLLNSRDVLTEIFRDVLSETILKIIQALANTFAETMERSHRHTNYFNKETMGDNWSDHPVHQVLQESNAENNYEYGQTGPENSNNPQVEYYDCKFA